MVSAAVIAMPVTAPASGSVTLPPRLTNDEISVPTAPDGAPASSVTAFSVTAVSASTGASLTAVTACDAVSVAVENAVALPLVEVSTLAVPFALPSVVSHARNVIAGSTEPVKFAFGWK